MNLPMDMILQLFLILLCLAFQALFSGSEISIVGCDRLVLKNRADNGDRGAQRVLKLLETPAQLVGTSLIGTSIFAVAGNTLVAHLLGDLNVSELAVVLVYTPVTILFSELIPKSIFHQYATTLSPWIAVGLSWIMVIFKPVLWVMEGGTRMVLKLFGVHDAQVHAVRREDIQLMLDDARIHSDEKEMIQRVFDFSDTLVSDVLVPLIEVVAISDTATCEEAAQAMAEAGHSRLPVYRKRIDRIVGVVSHQDVVFVADVADPPEPKPDQITARSLVTTVMRPVVFVPETQRLEVLFKEMRRRRTRLAIAVNEYGGAVGLVSMEDILEEIVGDIDDEFSRRAPGVRRVGEREWSASGRVEGERLKEVVGFEFPEGDYETLAGFLLDRFGHIPAVGEKLSWGNYLFTVTKATDRAILEVTIQDTSPRPGRAGHS